MDFQNMTETSEFAGAHKTNTSFLSPPGAAPRAYCYSQNSEMLGDLSPDHADSCMVAHDSGFQFFGGGEHSLALAGFSHDSAPVGH